MTSAKCDCLVQSEMTKGLQRMLVAVKAQPVIEQESREEAVCVAGIALEPPHRWIRLFPLDFRGLPEDRRFKKYSLIEFAATKAKGDPRPESLTPDLDSIRVVGHLDTDRGSWRRRLYFLESVEAESMCALQRGLKDGGPTLGIFRVKSVSGVKVEAQSGKFTLSQEAVLRQPSLLGGRPGDLGRIPLKPLPVKFKYQYHCFDSECKGHAQTIVDWELGALYLRLLGKGRSPSQIENEVRRKLLDDLCTSDREIRFLVGTMLRHPTSFLVLGVASPKKDKVAQSETLFP